MTFPSTFGGDPNVSRAAAGLFGTGGIVAVTVTALFADGPVGPNTISATASYTLTPVNTGTATQNAEFTFTIVPIVLEVVAGIGPGAPEAMRASYDLEILLNGASVFASGAELRGGIPGAPLSKTGVDRGGTTTASQFAFCRAHTTPLFTTTLALGAFAPGDAFTLSYSMSVRIQAPGETGALASLATMDAA